MYVELRSTQNLHVHLPFYYSDLVVIGYLCIMFVFRLGV